MNQEILLFWQSKFSTYLSENLNTEDASHDLGHFHRVWKTAKLINQQEGATADELVLLTAAYFHDFISYPKNHLQRSESSKLCAERVGEILEQDFRYFPKDKIPAVQHAIHAHSFSAQITPQTQEAKILQDADRMEALGAIGLARTFYVSGLMKSQLFHPEDPLAKQRPLDDTRYALDHFEAKLLQLPALMNTETGRKMAEEKANFLRQFREKIYQEILGNFE